MRSENPPAIRLADYRVPDFLVDHVELHVVLDDARTKVTATLALRRNPAGDPAASLRLDGDELMLVDVALDGKSLPQSAFDVSEKALTIPSTPDNPFLLRIVTALDPAKNTKLMGLYRSNGVYCTQCEADGFRRISFFPDRPDAMATWRVRIEGDRASLPLLLSNGNPVERGELPGGRHFVVWDDPHRKPCYLFALVAGDLDAFSGEHVTPSGRRVALNVYVERGKAARAAYAMDALKRSMRWDEEKFGREYDLDLFNIVAVSDFNMGAMENKGLNIFNDRYILASAETATDQDYHNIEAIVAHEYFHNWTGNRITCRDWFQLCLKEGLTVFRDQEFSSDQRSRPVERIANVQTLRAAQFVEDAGPLAHPVRPQAYKEVNNFYTATVYNKGSELIQMLRLMLGDAHFRAGMDLYFARHDGEATIVEAFIACFEAASGRDLSGFMRWYDQAGTPIVSVEEQYDAIGKRYTLRFRQRTGPTPGQPEKGPQIIPIRLGLLGASGRSLLEDDLIILDQTEASKTFEGIEERPIPSLLRGFSAPVRLEMARDEADLLVLASHDRDPFNRWQALQDAAIAHLKASITSIRGGGPALANPAIAAAIGRLLAGSDQDPAFAALAIGLPSEADMAREIGVDIDPEAIGRAIDAFRQAIGIAIAEPARSVYARLSTPVPFSPDGASAGRRALRSQVLRYLVAADPKEGAALAHRQFERADNMTDRMAALNALIVTSAPERDAALAAFEARYSEDALVLDMWFGLRARIGGNEAMPTMRALLSHPKFTLANPNRIRAVLGVFANGNPRAFHAPDGSGYRLLTEWIGAIDPRNPQVAARLATAFRTWKSLEPGRRGAAESALRALAAQRVSADLGDILERSLA